MLIDPLGVDDGAVIAAHSLVLKDVAAGEHVHGALGSPRLVSAIGLKSIGGGAALAVAQSSDGLAQNPKGIVPVISSKGEIACRKAYLEMTAEP